MVNADVLPVKANTSQDPKTRLSEYEMVSQIRSEEFLRTSAGPIPDSEYSTLLLAGHETTSNATSFMLWELAKHQDVQARLRREIGSVRAANGSTPLTAEDLDRMPYLQAVVKVLKLPIGTSRSSPVTSQEHFRFHPPVHNVIRRSGEDDVLPLFEPIKARSGTLITHLPLPKGTNIVLSFAAYNRYVDRLPMLSRAPRLTPYFSNKKIWGNDADVFRPERWLEQKERVGPNTGGYCNLWVIRYGHVF